MPDTFTKVTTQGYTSRIGSSIGMAIAGVLMFLASFGLLFWNEGRTDLSGVAAEATEISSTAAADAALEGTLVSTTGQVTSDELVGDLYLEDGSYLMAERRVEMYAWVEESEERSETNLGGSETTTTTYTYTKEWVTDPQSADEFTDPEGHTNPGMTVEGKEIEVGRFFVGVYDVEAGSVELPSPEVLTLTAANTVLPAGAELASDEFIFLGSGSLEQPTLGDIRVSYYVVPTDFTGTIFGELNDGEISMYVNEDGYKLFRLFEGSRDQAISALHSEFVVTTWILRVIGFLLMWFGMTFIIGPIATVLDVLPFLGSTTRFLVGLVMLPVAFVLSAVTILVSMVIHNLIALIIVMELLIGLIVWGLRRTRKAV